MAGQIAAEFSIGSGRVSWPLARRIAVTLEAFEQLTNGGWNRHAPGERHRAVLSDVVEPSTGGWQQFEHRGKVRLLVASEDLRRWVGVASPSLAGLWLTARLAPQLGARLVFAGAEGAGERHSGRFTFLELQSSRKGGSPLRVGVHETITRALVAARRSAAPVSGLAVRVAASLRFQLALDTGGASHADTLFVATSLTELSLGLHNAGDEITRHLRLKSKSGHGLVWSCRAAQEFDEMSELHCRVVLGEITVPLDEFLALKEGVCLNLACRDGLPVVFELGTTSVGRGRLTVREESVSVRIEELISLPRP